MGIFSSIVFLGTVLGGFHAASAASDPYAYKELVTRRVAPAAVLRNAAGHVLVDFGFDAVGWLELDGPAAGPYEIVLGELLDTNGFVTNMYPKAKIRCFRIKGTKPAGTHTWQLNNENASLCTLSGAQVLLLRRRK